MVCCLDIHGTFYPGAVLTRAIAERSRTATPQGFSLSAASQRERRYGKSREAVPVAPCPASGTPAGPSSVQPAPVTGHIIYRRPAHG